MRAIISGQSLAAFE